MATATEVQEKPFVDQIGEAAGFVWHTLRDEGPLTLSRLQKEVEAPANVVLAAVGWLAREGKIAMVENGRSRKISLV